MILTVILFCEIGFWVAVAAGLAIRYVLGRRRLSLFVLALAPVLDVVLLVATAAHLRSGATATWEHGLAALYLGFSIAYGHRLIGWADARFAHRFAGGPKPVRRTGREYTRDCWYDVARTALAAAVASAVAAALIAWVGDPERTEELRRVYSFATFILCIDLLWAISYTIWPRDDDDESRADAPAPDPTVR